MTKFPVSQHIQNFEFFDYLNFEQSIQRFKLCPTNTTRCHGMLMMQTYQQSIQESNEDSTSPHPIQVLHHVLKNVLRITTDERVSFTKWMQYHGYLVIQDIREGVPYILEAFHRY